MFQLSGFETLNICDSTLDDCRKIIFCVLNCKWDYFVTFWCTLSSNKQGQSYSKNDPLHKPMHQEQFFL